jgi:hypothetical protein
VALRLPPHAWGLNPPSAPRRCRRRRRRQALRLLRARGTRLRFVTNNSSKSRRAYVEKLAALSIEADASEASGAAAARPPAHPPTRPPACPPA